MSMVAIVLPVKNTIAFIDEALESIRRQTFTDWVAFVVDHGSTDGTLDVLDKYASMDSRFKVIDGSGCDSVSDLRNLGLSFVDSEYVIFCDADDVSLLNRFQALVDAHVQYPEAVVIGSNCRVIDGQGVLGPRMPIPESPRTLASMSLFRTPIYQPSASIKFSTFQRLAASYGKVFLPGAYKFKLDEKCVSEDYLLFMQIGLVGELRNLPAELLLYRWHRGNLSNTKRQTQLAHARAVSSLGGKIFEGIHHTRSFNPSLLSNHGNILELGIDRHTLREEYYAVQDAMLNGLGRHPDVMRELAFRYVLATRFRFPMLGRYAAHLTQCGFVDAQFRTVLSYMTGRVN